MSTLCFGQQGRSTILFLLGALSLNTVNPSDISVALHRLLIPWTDSDTWNSSFGGDGAQPDESESEMDADAVIPQPDIGSFGSAPVVDVTASLQAWSLGASNYGWVLLPGSESPNGWTFASSDHPVEVSRPLLEVRFFMDCNANGIPDECEPDLDGDGIIDECDDDIDGDDVPNGVDACPAALASCGVDAEGRALGDLDGDCDVDLSDFACFAQNYTGPR